MQSNVQIPTQDIEIETISPETDMASLYRTQWLMAHNRLHEAVHQAGVPLENLWNAYLAELRTAEDKASIEA